MGLLKVDNLCIDLAVGGRRVPVVSSLSFEVGCGEFFALVGESGCGKSISCLALTRLLDPASASVRARSIELNCPDAVYELSDASEKELRRVRGRRIAYIFQEPAAALNPVFRVGDQIGEAVRLHRSEVQDVKAEVVRLLSEVGIPDPVDRAGRYPHELSGGMQQRVMIAMALASNPALLVADEPTTALDVTIQAQILELLKKTCRERDMGVILVTHNLGIVAEMADRVAVMYAGHQVEQGACRELLDSPLHPYTRALLAAVPVLGSKGRRLATIPGSVPAIGEFNSGCRFFGRCALAASRTLEEQARCRGELPPLAEIAPGRRCRCFFAVPEDKP